MLGERARSVGISGSGSLGFSQGRWEIPGERRQRPRGTLKLNFGGGCEGIMVAYLWNSTVGASREERETRWSDRAPCQLNEVLNDFPVRYPG